jgi:hypothetical protein
MLSAMSDFPVKLVGNRLVTGWLAWIAVFEEALELIES